MAAYLIRRILILIPTLFAVTIVTFFALHSAPGDPASILAGPEASAQDIANIRHELGLDQPVINQYFRYLWKLLHGDMGISLTTRRSVTSMVLVRYPNTVRLAFASILITIILGVGGGVIAAIRPRSILDNITTPIALVGVAMPGFWLGLMLMYLFGIKLRWLPVAGFMHPVWSWGGIKDIIMPAFSLGFLGVASVLRLTRSSMLDVLGKEYIRTAWSKGLSEWAIIVKHAFRNAAIPVVTILGMRMGIFLGGTVIIESVFAINGVGRMVLRSILTRDYPVLAASVLLIAATFAIVNLFVDVSYSLIDVRIRYD